jgi:hypothetical protein
MEDVPLQEIEQALQTLADDDMLILYAHDGKELYQVVNWWEYQGSMTWAWPSDYPPPKSWMDRIRYRQGNRVMEHNWDGAGGLAVAPAAHREPTVRPPPPDSDDNIASAPNGNGKLNGNDNGTTEGAGAPPNTFPEWHDLIRDSKNRPATLRWMIEVLYPGLDPPDYGFIGRVARHVGGAGRLADLLWQHSTRPPTGDVLAYILAVAKNNGSTDKTNAQLAEEILAEMDDGHTS